MKKIKITPVGSAIPELVDKKDFLGALETCDQVNNILTISGKQYILNSIDFCGLTQDVPNWCGAHISAFDVGLSKPEFKAGDTSTFYGKIWMHSHFFQQSMAQNGISQFGKIVFEIKNMETGQVFRSDNPLYQPFDSQGQGINLISNFAYEFKVALRIRIAGKYQVTPIVISNGGESRGLSWTFAVIDTIPNFAITDLYGATHLFADPVFFADQWVGGCNMFAGSQVIAPEPMVSVKVADCTVRFPGSDVVSTISITNNGNSPIRLGEVQLSDVRILDPRVIKVDNQYPRELLAQEGLFVSDNSPLAPGETRTVEVLMSCPALENPSWLDKTPLVGIHGWVYELNGIGKIMHALCFFFDAEGQRQVVPVTLPYVADINTKMRLHEVVQVDQTA